ncbi:MAG: hypothetical protein FWG98_08760 [Candidatus Cloacimonetes bacterium]|nr:hypothetical protein [Candidatus Cloacimonadota bacterium]
MKINKILWIITILACITILSCSSKKTTENSDDNGNEKDVITWTAVSESIFGSSSIWSIVYGAGKFLAVGNEGKMAYSFDGISWISVDNSPFSTNNYRIAIAYGNGIFVAAGRPLGGFGPDIVAYSQDGISWTIGANSILTSTYDMAFGNGKFVMGRQNMAYSTNGQAWSEASNDFSSYPYLTFLAIAYGNERFVAGGNSGSAKGKVAYSFNGETWNVVDDNIIDTNAVISDIAYGNNIFVAVGGDGQFRIAYSSDGLNWTATNTTGYFYSVEYGGGKFVAIGNRTVYSLDGITWNSIPNSGINSVRTETIAYGAGRFVVGKAMGGIWYSNIQE